MKKQRALWWLASLSFFLLLSSGSSALAGGTQALQFGAPVSISGLATQGVGLSVAVEGRQLSDGAETQRLSLKINPADCSLEAAEQGVSLQIKDAVGAGAPGQPELPLVVKRIILPANSEVTGVSIIGGAYLPILNRLAIKVVAQPKALDFPSPNLSPEGRGVDSLSSNLSPEGRGVKGEGIDSLARDEKGYSQTSYFPGNIISFFAAPSRTETVVYLRFNPVQYIPGQESAILVSALDVEVKYNSGTQPLGRGIGPGSLIICPERYLRAANALADLHQRKFNLAPLVVTTEYINRLGYGGTGVPPLAPYPDAFCPQGGFSGTSLPGQGTVAAGGYNGDMAKKIASYIQESKTPDSIDGGWAYFPELQYVVILGNAKDVPPSYYVYNIPEGSSYMGRDSWIPTDYFYSLSSYGSIVPNFGVGRISVMNVPYAEHLTVSTITGPGSSGYYTVTVSGAAWDTGQWTSYNIQLQDNGYSDTTNRNRILPVILANNANSLTVDSVYTDSDAVPSFRVGDIIKIVAGADYLVAKESKWFDAAFGSYTPETFPRDPSHWFYSAALAGGDIWGTWLYLDELDCLSIINKVDADYDNHSLLTNIRTKKYFSTNKKDYYRSSAEWEGAFCRNDVLPLLTGGINNGFVYTSASSSGKTLFFDSDYFDGRFSGFPTESISTSDLLNPGLSAPAPLNLPIFIGNSLDNFDELIWSSGGSSGPSLGEAALLSRAGAIACIGSTRNSWLYFTYSFNKGNLSFETTLTPEILRNIFLEYHRQGNTLGTLVTKARIDYLGSYYGTSNWTTFAWRTFFQNTLLGDPALFIPTYPAPGLAENTLADTVNALSPRTKTPSYNDAGMPVYEVTRGNTKTVSTSFTGGASQLQLTLIDPRWRQSEDRRNGWSSVSNYSFSFADRETDTSGGEVSGTVGGPSVYFLRAAVQDPNNNLYTKEKRIYYEGVNEFVPQGKVLVIDDDQSDRLRLGVFGTIITPRDNAEYEYWYEEALQANNYHRLNANGYVVWHNDNNDGSNNPGSASTSVSFGIQNQGRYGEITQEALNAYKSASKAVIYFTGDDNITTLLPQDQTCLDTYLNTGGRLFITGQNIGSNIGGTSFYQNDLYATYRQDNIMRFELDGVPGNPMTDGFFDININPNYAGGALNQHSPSEIDPRTGAEPILFYRPGSGPGGAIGIGCAGLSVYDGTKALVYLPFGFEGIQTLDDVSRGRKQVMGSIMNWLFHPTQTMVFSATAEDAQVLLSWRTPNAANFQGTQIVFKTGSYPVSEADGTVIYRQDGLKSTVYSFTHTPLVNDTTYYYAAYWYNTSAGYTFIGQASATPKAGAAITYSVSGTVQDSSSNPMDGVTLTLQSGGNPPLTTTTSSGAFTFSNVPGDNYTLTASKSGWVFEPGQRSFVLSGNRTGENFTGYLAHSVSGTITREVGGAKLAGVRVELKYWTGVDTQIVSQNITDAYGAYTVWGRGDVSPGRQYTIVPGLAGWKFTPTERPVSIIASNISGKNFTAKEAKYIISGKITQGAGTAGLSGVLLTLTRTGFSDSKTTVVDGIYQFIDIPAGAYTLTPQKTGWTFQPVQISIPALDDDLLNQNFRAYLEITFTTTPSGNPNPVTKGSNAVQCTAAAQTVLGSTITYKWTASDGYFKNTGLLTSSGPNPVWIADVAMSPFEEYKLVRIQVTASCTNGLSQTAYYFQRVNPATEPVGSGSGSGGGGPVGPLAVGISALLGWWKRRRKRLSF